MKFFKFIVALHVVIFLNACKSSKQATTNVQPEEKISVKDKRMSETLFVTGMKHYILEDYDKAMSYFQKSHVLNPNSAGTNFQIAQIYVGSGYPLQALPYAEKALALNDSNVYYYQILAKCYTENANNAANDKDRKSYLKKAAVTYEALVKMYPSEDDVYFELANIYLQQGDVESGLRSIEKIEEKYGVTEEISLQKQQIYLHINQFDNAVKEGQKLIEAFPEQPKYKVSLAKLYFTNDKPEDAKRVLQEMGDESDLDGESKVMLSDIYWTLNEKEKSNKLLLNAFNDPDYNVDYKINIAVGFINAESNRLNPDELEEACKSILELHPLNPKSYIVYGDFLLKQKRKKEGRAQYLKALSIDNSFYQVWQNVIILDSDLNEQDSIINHTESAIEVFPNQGIFWYYNGAAYLAKKDYKKSTYSFEKSKKLIGTTDGLILIINAQLGDAYNGLKNYQLSDAAYEEVLATDPNNVHVLNNYSYFLSLRNEKLEVAEKMCQKLMELEPDNSTYLDTYAWVLYKMNNYLKAKELLEKALLSSDDGTIIEHYGDVLYKLGKKDEALVEWKKAKNTGDYSEFLDKKLADGKLYE